MECFSRALFGSVGVECVKLGRSHLAHSKTRYIRNFGHKVYWHLTWPHDGMCTSLTALKQSMSIQVLNANTLNPAQSRNHRGAANTVSGRAGRTCQGHPRSCVKLGSCRPVQTQTKSISLYA